MGGHDGEGLCECLVGVFNPNMDGNPDLEMVDPCCPLEGHKAKVTSVAFSPTGDLVVSGSEDRLVKIWNSATGEEVICLVCVC